MSCRSDTQVAHTAPPLLLQGRVTFTGVSHEQQRIQRHQQLREKRLQQLEEARLAKVAEAEARRKRRRTAKAQATVDHLSLTAANNMTRSVNEALATYCRFEELPMYQPAKRGVDERVTLGYTFQGMPVRFQPYTRTPLQLPHTPQAPVFTGTQTTLPVKPNRRHHRHSCAVAARSCVSHQSRGGSCVEPPVHAP